MLQNICFLKNILLYTKQTLNNLKIQLVLVNATT